MRKPNGFGGIVKNGGARRKPYQLRKTIRVYGHRQTNVRNDWLVQNS